MRLLNQGPPFDPLQCRPTWPSLPAGASLTVDPSRPPPTTAQNAFCDWPSGQQVASYPAQCIATIVSQPRLSNPGRQRLRNPGCDAQCAWDCLQDAKAHYFKEYGPGVPKAWIYGRAVACINKIAGLPPPPGYDEPAPSPGGQVRAPVSTIPARRVRARARRANPLRFARVAREITQMMGGNR